jgi:hypothetical protein
MIAFDEGKTKVDSSVAPEAKNCYYVVSRKILWTRSEGVITPPCHGGDRRFKSGRVRQEKIPSKDGIFSWSGPRIGFEPAGPKGAGSWSAAKLCESLLSAE